MGINISRVVSISENIYLTKFLSTRISVEDDQFWENFLCYYTDTPSTSQEHKNVDCQIESLCASFVVRNLETGNFGSLVAIFLNKIAELSLLSNQESAVHVWQAHNALLIIRTIVKYVIETENDNNLLELFEATSDIQELRETNKNVCNTIIVEIKDTSKDSQLPNKSGREKLEVFIDALFNLIIAIPVKEVTYYLHLEAVNTIVILLSIHVFSPQSPEKLEVFRKVYETSTTILLSSTLLHFVAQMYPAPQTRFGTSSGGSFVFEIAESLLSIFTFRKPHVVLNTSNPKELAQQLREHYPLANQSLLLLLILMNHQTDQENAYRNNMFKCSDKADPLNDGSTFKIDFSGLYNTLCQIITIDQATLLLYLLLHRNQRFYEFVTSQNSLQNLVIPILQTLYNAPNCTSHHIYMSLIVLLILTEDDGFNKQVHQITLKTITWYTERSISEISLGGLLILVVIRTIQYNMLKMRDKYLHTNCLAALANMSGQFRYLHPYVAQRLVSLFETLAKKHTRLNSQIKEPVNRSESFLLNSSPEDMLQDLNVLEEVLRMVLEILNSCLSNQLVHCPNLVYTLLYKRQVFEGFRNHQAFQDIIQNIDMVVGFFSSRLQRVQDQRGELSVNEVLEVISKGACQWSSDRLRKFPDLRFKYIEEDAPEEFFIPYIWTLVFRHGSVHFSSENMKEIQMEISW